MSLIAKEIYKIYRNGAKEVRAVSGVSLEIERGKSLAIVGPSGAGKSTLLHLLGGLDKLTSGVILLDGVDLYKLTDRDRAKVRNSRIGFVFQFYHLLPEFTALENVMMPGLIQLTPRLRSGQAGNGIRDTKKRAMEILRVVGLTKRINHKPGELSGGESQRVAIARALANEPEILLCDEPTGNLDSKTSSAIFDLLFEIKKKANTTLIIVTHDETISSHMDRTVRIKDGKIV